MLRLFGEATRRMASEPRHIRLTSHPGQQGPGNAPAIHWGAADALERGPIVGTTGNRSQRNVIGTHSGSYGVYRALAVAAGNLTKGHRADLTNTVAHRSHRALRAMGRRQEDRVDRSVGRVGAGGVRRLPRAGLRRAADDRGDQGAHPPARDQAGDRLPAPGHRRRGAARRRLGRGDQDRHRAGVVAAGRGRRASTSARPICGARCSKRPAACTRSW